jgi:hypothetical protein
MIICYGICNPLRNHSATWPIFINSNLFKAFGYFNKEKSNYLRLWTF